MAVDCDLYTGPRLATIAQNAQAPPEATRAYPRAFLSAAMLLWIVSRPPPTIRRETEPATESNPVRAACVGVWPSATARMMVTGPVTRREVVTASRAVLAPDTMIGDPDTPSSARKAVR